MKRPRFFEDLDRSISGEPEPQETPCAPVAIVHDLAAKGRAIRAEEDFLQAIAEQDDMATQLNRAANAAFSAHLMQATQWRQELQAAQIDAIRNTTATGAMILAQQQRREFGSVFGQLFGDALGQGFRRYPR